MTQESKSKPPVIPCAACMGTGYNKVELYDDHCEPVLHPSTGKHVTAITLCAICHGKGELQ